MGFEQEFPEYLRERRKLASVLDPGLPGLHVGETGSRWPDLMSCGNPPPSFVFSRKIVMSLESRDIALRRITPIPIGSIENSKLRNVPAPEYFVIEALPGIQVDYAASGYVVDVDGNPNLNAVRSDSTCILQYDPLTWSGADLFCQSNGHGAPRYLDLLCTERIVEIAKEDGWEDAAFQRVRVKGVNPVTGQPE